MSRPQLLKSGSIVAAMTLVSRILGFARDMVVARYFGVAAGTDAFFVAFKIPNLLRRLFAEGAFSQAFVPVFADQRAKLSEQDIRSFVAEVGGTLGGVLLIMSALGVLAAPAVVVIFAPGFLRDPDKFQLAVGMLRLTFPYLFFIGLTALAGGLLNSYQRFAVPALTPVFLNLVLIAAAIWLAPHLAVPVESLAWGVMVAGVVQLGFQLPFLQAVGLLVRPVWRWGSSGVQRIIRLMLPGIFGSSVAQINLLINTLIASFLVTGSVSWLYYSDRLVEFPLGVFGVAIATVILPHLSDQHAQQGGGFSATLDWALRLTLLIGLPATTGLIVLSGPLLVSLFHYGEFSAHDVSMAQLSLIAYSVGLLGFMGVKVLAPGFYARQDMRTPVRLGLISLGVNFALNVVLVWGVLLLKLPGAHGALALATSVSALVNGGLLLRRLRHERIYVPAPGWRRYLGQLIGASALMGVVVAMGSGSLQQWMAWGAGSRSLHLLGWVFIGALVYGAALWIFGLRGDRLRQIWRHGH